MAIEIFGYNDYRAFIRARVKQAGKPWGIWTRLAKAANCQTTYMSQAMSEIVHLTPEQICGIADYLQLSEEEEDFLMLLLNYARAGTRTLRDRLWRKIEKIRKAREDIAQRIRQPRINSGEFETVYYSAWYWAALHILVTIPRLQTSEALARKLSLPLDFVEHIMNELAANGLVSRQQRRWLPSEQNVHLPKNSPLISLHHNNWRQQAILSYARSNDNGIHFTGVYSLSVEDMRKIRELTLQLIETARNIVTPSSAEILMCMACDLFEIGTN